MVSELTSKVAIMRPILTHLPPRARKRESFIWGLSLPSSVRTGGALSCCLRSLRGSCGRALS